MAEQYVRVRPPASEEYLGNPHKGCCTFQHFNGDPLFPGTGWSESGPEAFPPPPKPGAPSGDTSQTVQGYLPTTVAYCRWFWNLMEPRKGKFDFTVIDKSLEVCARRGQRLAFRAMAFGGGPHQPAVPQWYSDRYPMQRYHDTDFMVPDPNSPQYLEHWGDFIRELGQRFDGHPLAENYTCAFMGPWGEGDADMADEQIERFAQVFCEAFPRTLKIWELAGNQMRIGLRMGGGGWRANSFGDLGNIGSDYVTKDVSWNHHYDCYPQHTCASGVTEAWKTGPVFFESGWVPMTWYQKGFDLDFILQQGLKFHTTYFMPKYTYLPDPWIDKLSVFCRQIGYRYIFRQAKFYSKVPRGGQTAFECWIENVGVAPLYYRYDFALRFRQDDNSFIVPFDDLDVRTWLPGDICIDRPVTLPAGLRPGLVELSAGLIDRQTQQAAVSFANKPRFTDRWLCLGKFEVV